MSKKRRQFDRAFKVEAVRLVTEERRPVAAVARDLGIGRVAHPLAVGSFL